MSPDKPRPPRQYPPCVILLVDIHFGVCYNGCRVQHPSQNMSQRGSTSLTQGTLIGAQPLVAPPNNMNPVVLPSNNEPASSTLAAVLLDDRAIAALIDQLLARAGLSQAECCRRLGISPSSFNQYRLGRRLKPSLWWMVRLSEVCGAKIFIEFPSRPL